MGALRGDDYLEPLMEQRMEDDLAEVAWEQLRTELVTDLQYRSYRWQRSFYGLAADRLAKVFPRAEQFEKAYQEELGRAA